MEKYLVIRCSGGVRAAYIKDEKQGFEEVPHVVYHSPTGMEFGYAGSGPADLALSILVHYFNGDREKADRLHQRFKFEFIAPASGNQLIIEVEKIRAWLEKQEAA